MKSNILFCKKLINRLFSKIMTETYLEKNNINDLLIDEQFKTILNFIKIVLILQISLIDFNKLVFNIFSDSDTFTQFSISQETINVYSEGIKKQKKKNISKLPTCTDLYNKSIQDLVMMFNSEDLYFYSLLNKCFIGKRDAPKSFIFKDKQIELNFWMKESFVAAKNKRYDEIIKFSFKFVRRQVLFQFQKKFEFNNLNQKQLKLKFNEMILEGKKELIDNFFSYEVSIQSLKIINSNPILNNIILDYIENDFISDFLYEIGNCNHSEIFSNHLLLGNFYEMMFSIQQKKKLMLEDLYTSFTHLKKYFSSRS